MHTQYMITLWSPWLSSIILFYSRKVFVFGIFLRVIERNGFSLLSMIQLCMIKQNVSFRYQNKFKIMSSLVICTDRQCITIKTMWAVLCGVSLVVSFTTLASTCIKFTNKSKFTIDYFLCILVLTNVGNLDISDRVRKRTCHFVGIQFCIKGNFEPTFYTKNCSKFTLILMFKIVKIPYMYCISFYHNTENKKCPF
jgi:hypothetical protein